MRIPKRKVYDPATKKHLVERNVVVQLTSSPVNCLADIPIAHLSYHAIRYGKFAIGFHRDSAIKHGFSPLLYSLNDAAFLRSINRGFAVLDSVEIDAVTAEASNIMWEMENSTCEYGHHLESDAWGSAQNIEMYGNDIDDAISDAKSSFQRLLAFVKTFDRDEFNSIYCEREWRSIRSFKFAHDDLAMIVVPKVIGRRRYFDELIEQIRSKHKVARKIPIVPWEDLIEH